MIFAFLYLNFWSSTVLAGKKPEAGGVSLIKVRVKAVKPSTTSAIVTVIGGVLAAPKKMAQLISYIVTRQPFL